MARVLAVANARKAVETALTAARAQDADDVELDPMPSLKAGHMKLYPMYQPSLYPSVYGVEAKQFIEANARELHVFNYDSVAHPNPPDGQDPPTSLQTFTIVAPQFQLDPKLINSYYPPDGHVDAGLILPHIVFNDPHVPWERIGFRYPASTWPPVAARWASVPWLALVVFDPDELKLTAEEGAALQVPGFNVNALPSSGAFPMTVGDYLTKITSRVNYDAAYTENAMAWAALTSSTEATSIIFPRKDDVQIIFDHPVKFVLTSHVREINTEGFPGAGVEEHGLVSICISHRSGPTVPPEPGTTQLPRMQTVHLVSIENIFVRGGNLAEPLDPTNSSARMGMVSLFSWSYLSVPKLPTDFKSTMQTLADQKQMLRPPDPILKSIQPAVAAGDQKMQTAAATLLNRLSHGYSIARWRTSTGEETTAFFRGPLTPVRTSRTPSLATDWPSASNAGKDYQILEKATGMMDVSYSSAWQLGKLLAISDPVFSAALLRLRSTIMTRASSHTRMLVNGMKSASSIINNTPATFAKVTAKANGSNIPMRNNLPVASRIAPPLKHRRIHPVFRQAVRETAEAVTASFFRPPFFPSVPIDPDWQIIRDWISDKLYLDGIPFHYLLSDPSHLASSLAAYTVDKPIPLDEPISLPQEALRFFHIDDAWLDCLLDGALSTSNHFDPVNDAVRDRLKAAYNLYLTRPLQPSTMKPQVPRYGFMIRSTLMKVMPDIRVTVQCRKVSDTGEVETDNAQAPLVRLSRLDDLTLLALLDCLPEEVDHITLAQPPHQQRFIVPRDATRLTRLYATGAPEGTGDDGRWLDIPAESAPTQTQVDLWYNESTRCLDIVQMNADLASALAFDDGQGKSFPDITTLDSAMFALELNDKSWQLDIHPPQGSVPNVTPAPDRQLWRGSSPAAVRTSELSEAQPAVDPSKASALRIEPLQSSGGVESRGSGSLDSATRNVRGGTSVRSVSTSAGLVAADTLSALKPEYVVSIHPTDRGPAPLPIIRDPSSTTPLSKVYSAHDYLPSDTPYLLDLVFAIHRDPTGVRNPLSSITFIIPVQTQLNQAMGSEPLLILTPPTPIPTATMLYNRRLVPIVSVASSNDIDSSPTELRITIVPRSAKPGIPKVLPARSTDDASFVLHGCAIAEIQSLVDVEVFGQGTVKRGLAKVAVIEGYLDVMGEGSTDETLAIGSVDVPKTAA